MQKKHRQFSYKMSAEEFDIIIEPKKPIGHYWKDLWKFRSLFLFLAWRDLLVRYKQTAIGISWSVLRPFLTLVVFTVIFGIIANLPDQGFPYALLVAAGMIPWQFFSNSFADSSMSLISNSNLVSKIYFPRLIVPASSLIVSLVDFCISLTILFGLMLYYQFVPSFQILLLPLFLILAIVVSFGLGIFISALNVKYRDFRFIVPFMVQIGLFISPVGFSSEVIPEKYRLLYSLNPMVGVIDGFRWCILGGESKLYMPGFLLSVLIALIIFFSGIQYFRKSEKTFVDII
jgi:lipopolysaccharide transport system permease protein